MSEFIKHTPKLWEAKHDNGSGASTFLFWCPACKAAHTYDTGGQHRPNWTFDGNLESPTFTPSLRYLTGTKCHLFVTNGVIQYCGDCPHDMAGKSTPMVDIPEDWV